MTEPEPEKRVYAWWEIALMILCVGGGVAYGFALMLSGTPGG